MIDVPLLTDAFMARIRTDAVGASVRALLGSNESVVTADRISAAIPRPFLALRAMPIIQRADHGFSCAFVWWCYDDAQRGYSRINQLLPLVAAAYAPRLVVATIPINLVETASFSQELVDKAMGGLFARTATINIYA